MTNEIEYSAHFEEADRFLRRPYARIILPESDGTFRGEIMEFPGCIATGDSAPETLATLEEVARSWLLAALARGQIIPEPIDNNNDFSGRLVIRIPKSLHKKAAWIAEREGVSLNHFITTSLSESVGERNVNVTSVFISPSALVASCLSASVVSNFAPIPDLYFVSASDMSTYSGTYRGYTAGNFSNAIINQTITGGKNLALLLAGSTMTGTGPVAVSGMGPVAANLSSEGAVNFGGATTVPPNIHFGDEPRNKRA